MEKGYEVHGIVRRASLINTYRIDHIYDQIKLHYGDLTDSTNLVRVIQQVQPDEIYNLGAQSHVKVSFEMPEYTGSSKTTESHMDYMQVLEFFSITNPLEEEKLLSQEKSLADYHLFQLGNKIYYISAT